MTARNRFLVVLSFGVVVTVASLVALYGREELMARESAIAQSETAAAAAAAAIDSQQAEAAASGDFAATAAVTSDLFRIQLANPRIRQISALMPSGQPETFRIAVEVGGSPSANRPGSLVRIDDADARSAADAKNSVSSWKEDSVSTWAPILDRSRVAGLIRIEYDAAGIGSGIAPALFALMLGLLVTLVLVVFVSRSIGRRLGILLDGTGKLAEGDLAHRVEVRGHDEISELAESFNSMADALEENRSSLGNAIAELGRTSALVETRARENEALLKRTVEAVDGERRRLATELHDSTIQSLQSIGMLAEYAEMLIERGQYEEASERVISLRQRLNDSVAELRRLLFDLRPPNLDDTGLASALELRLSEVSDLGDLETRLEIADDLDIPNELETVIYRFCQEALSNVVRHAEATSVEVRVWQQGAGLRVAVEDNGKGFDSDTRPEHGHFGIQGMRERAELAGGELSLESRLGSKTRVELTLPLGSDTPA
ncbi:MAG: hypothetical protein DCC49_08760 [Acidobacteria bacterium]|nr:MAG: hypothetical protein DCC49_08760 [Acidobacteriota bacterium]